MLLRRHRARFSRFIAPLGALGLAGMLASGALVVCSAEGCGGASNAASGDDAGVVDGGGDDAAADAPLVFDPSAPPRVCKTPPAPNKAWFTDVTADVGLAPSAALTPAGSVVVSADFDEDGYSDVIVIGGAGDRSTKKQTFLFLHRVDSAGKHGFVESSAGSGLDATRDGAGGRSFGLAVLGDLNGDGHVDALVCPSWVGADGTVPTDACEAFLNDGKAHFTLAAASDLDAKSFVTPSGSLLDYDRDGILDFWPATIARWPYGGLPDQKVLLFRGKGDGTFSDVTASVGLPTTVGALPTDTAMRPFFGATACDIDGDGDDDMILATYGRQENWVFRNDAGKFVEVGRALGIAHDDRENYRDDQSYLCYCADPINAGKPDCTPAPPAPGMKCDVFGGPYLRGWGPGSERSYSLGGNNFSIACNDIDDDGDMDLMTATIVHGDVGSSSDPSELVINPGDGSKLTRPGNDKTGMARPESGLYWNHGDDMAVMVDLDLDGKKDVFLTTTGAYPNSHSWLWHQKSDGTFEEIGVAAGLSAAINYHGPAFVDFDGDGDLDLIVGDTNTGAIHAFRNDVGQSQNWLKVRLRGKGAGGSNRDGIGAKVTVTAGGVRHVQELQGGFGHGNVENDLVLTFGLGSACDVERVEVKWPNSAASVSTYGPIRANYAVALSESDGKITYLR